MVGVDRMDRMTALHLHWAYRMNKWTVRVLLNCSMLALVNIWFEKGKPMRVFDFGLQLSEDLISPLSPSFGWALTSTCIL